MDVREELFSHRRVERDVAALQMVLDLVARRMLFMFALAAPIMVVFHWMSLMGPSSTSAHGGFFVVPAVICSAIAFLGVRKARLSARQIGIAGSALASLAAMYSMYFAGLGIGVVTFILVATLVLALFVGRRAALLAGAGLWSVTAMTFAIREWRGVNSVAGLLDLQSGLIGSGAGIAGVTAALVTVVLIADSIPLLLRNMERALEERSMERERRWQVQANSEQRMSDLQRFIDHAPVAIICLDENGVVQVWSESNQLYSGMSSDQVVGQSYEAFLAAQSAGEDTRARVRRLLSGESYSGVLQELATELGPRTLVVEGKPLVDDGRLTGAIIVGLDVTVLLDPGITDGEKPKISSESLLAELSKKLKKLQSVVLSAGINVQTQAHRLSQNSPEVGEIREATSLLLETHAKAAYLIDEAVALVTGPGEDPEGQPVAPILRTVEKVLKQRLSREKVSVDIDDAFSEGAAIERGAVLIKQVLINLVSNAIDVLSTQRQVSDKRISLSLIADDASLTFTVEDNAGSRLPVNHDVLFNSGYSTNRDGARAESSLFVSRRTIEQLKGTLDVEQGAKGLRFRMTLPRFNAKDV